jgi:lipoprotein signal peptidase
VSEPATRRRTAVALAAVVLGAVLIDDALAPTTFRHHRSPGTLLFAGVLAAALLGLAPRIRSAGVVVGAGVAAGGALATFVSGLAWGGVPDPLVRGSIAFNVADVAIACGDALLIVAALVHAWTNRARLGEPV